ncbi:MAG: HDOD domain-containing protein [Gammaproteobacteria bacterium]|nr:HDOD domain-containing protein [Gammaproteobacteria bacterium]
MALKKMPRQSSSGQKNIDGIYYPVYRKVISGEARLPSLPDVAFKVRRAVARENVTVKDIAKIVQTDPPLVTRLILCANSPLYRSARPSVSVSDAIRRIGLQATRNLVYSHSLSSLFEFRSPVLREVSNKLWKESIKTASIASVLSVYSHGVSADKALLAGLVQDIGALPLLAELSENYPDISKDKREVYRVLNNYKRKVGYHLLRKWEFENELLDVVKTRNQWLRKGGEKIDLSDILLLARWHSYVGTSVLGRLPRVLDMPAYQKFPVNKLSPEQSLQVLDDARDQQQEIMDMLN